MATVRIALSRVTALHLPFGLLWGYIAGHVVSATWYASQVVRKHPTFARYFFNKEYITRAARRFKQFPRFSMPSTLLNTLQSRLPFLLLFFFFDESTVGYFGRAFALFAVPLSLIGNAISQVFFVEGAIARRENTLAKRTTKVHDRLVVLGLFPTLAILITGPQVMGFFLGEAMEPAGVYLQWLAPWFFMASIASPLTRIFDILEQQRTDFLTSIVIFTIQTGLFIFGCLTGDLMLALIYLSAGGFISRVIHVAVMLRLSGTSLKSALTPYVQQFLLSIPFLVILYFIQRLDTPWLTSAALALSGFVFLLLVYRRLTR